MRCPLSVFFPLIECDPLLYIVIIIFISYKFASVVTSTPAIHMAPRRNNRSRRQEPQQQPQTSTSRSPLNDDRPRRALRQWTTGEIEASIPSDSRVEPARNPFAPRTPDNTTGARSYRLRDSVQRAQGRSNQPTVSPTDRFIQRRRRTPARSRGRYNESPEAVTEGTNRRSYSARRGDTGRERRHFSVFIDENDLEEGEIQPNRTEYGIYDAQDLENEEYYAEDPEEDDRSVRLARGPDPTPGSEESDRPRPGFGTRWLGDVDFFIDPDDAILSIEAGEGDPIVPLQAQRDEYKRTVRRLRNELVDTEDRVRELEQNLEQRASRVTELEEVLGQTNEELDDVTQVTHRVVAQRDELQDQVNQNYADSRSTNMLEW